MASQELYNRLNRALQRQSGQHPEGRRQLDELTARGQHPTKGSAAIRQMAASGAAPIKVISLNVPGATSTSRAFLWGVKGFGWGDGILL
jgi:hypothetical protein